MEGQVQGPSVVTTREAIVVELEVITSPRTPIAVIGPSGVAPLATKVSPGSLPSAQSPGESDEFGNLLLAWFSRSCRRALFKGLLTSPLLIT